MQDEEALDSTERLAAHVAGLVTSAKEYLDEQQKARQTAMEYYGGVMLDFPADPHKSAVVSMDVREAIKKIMPSIMRTIFGGGDVVKYTPKGPEDEEGAQQATEYVNAVSVPECNAERALHDAIHDALLLKTGILKWSAYRKRKVTIQEYTKQPDEAVIGLFDDELNNITNYVESEETDQQVLALDPNARRHTFKLRRMEETITPKIEAVPRGSFLITPGAESIEDAELVGEEMLITRSALVSMGYDKELVWQIPTYDAKAEDDESRMGEDYTETQAETRKALETVQIWEVYVRVDMDEDGIAEVHRIVFGDGATTTDTKSEGAYVVLGLEPVDEAPYASVVMERDPHQFEGHSVYEDLRDVQRVKTALLRQTLDNLYSQNNPQPYVDYNRVENPEAVMNGKFGEPVLLKSGANADEVVQWKVVPFFADKSYEMLGYMDEVARARTGIADASGGLEADKLHNIAATTALLASQPAIAQADAIVRSLANGGLRKAFKGLLRLVIAHSDGPRTVQMKGKWVQYDPTVWNMDMDCTVNVGLGGGTKERDMAVLQVIYGLQKELLLSIGPENPYVKPDQLYNTLEKMTETAGFASAQPFFTDPDMQQVQAQLEAAKNAPNPDVEKIQAQGQVQMQLEQMKAQTTLQLEQAKLQLQAESERMKAEVARDKEMAQMQADLTVKQNEAQQAAAVEQQKMQMQAALERMKLDFEREKLGQDREIKLMELQAQIGMAEHSAATKAAEDGQRKAGEGKSLDALSAAIAGMSKARRVIRDDAGEIIGVEPVN